MSEIRVQELAHTNGTSALEISSGGIITQPAKPAFQARGAASWTDLTISFATAAFSVEQVDVGGDYDHATNYAFTAPVAGVYYFYYSMYAAFISGQGDNANYLESHLSLNNLSSDSVNDIMSGRQIFGYQNQGDYDGNMVGSCVVDLSVNDTIRVKIKKSSSGFNARYYGNHSVFCGYLIG